MLWIYAAAVFAFYAIIFIFKDDASEDIRKWIYPILIVLGILGGLYLTKTPSDDACTRYSSIANDC